MDAPLSLNQEDVVAFHDVESYRVGASTRYQFVMAFRVHGSLDVTALASALRCVVARHTALRTAFCHRDTYSRLQREKHIAFFERSGLVIPGLMVQRIVEDARLPLEEYALPPVEADASERQLWKAISEEASRPLRIDVAPAMRAILIRSGAANTLVLVLSHLVFDGWSLRLLAEELNSAYVALRDRRNPSLPPVPLQYHEFATWQWRQYRAGAMTADEKYWKRQWMQDHSDGIWHNQLPFARRVSQPGHVTEVQRVTLNTFEVQAIRSMLHGLRVTPHVFFRTVVTALLHSWTQSRCISLWASFANRDCPGSERMIGWCSNVHLVRVNVVSSTSFAALTADVSLALRDAQKYAALPLPALWNRLGQRRRASDTRLNCDMWPVRYGTESRTLEILWTPVGLPQLDFDVRIDCSNRDYSVLVVYNAARYARAGVTSFGANIRRACLEAFADLQRPISAWRACDDFD